MNQDILSFYARSLRIGNDRAQQVGWESEALQRARFAALLTALPPGRRRERFSLLDIGCGLGELYAYLLEQGLTVDYFGIDLHQAAIEQAQVRFPNARFDCVDFLGSSSAQRYDLVLCSGGLSLRFETEQQSWSFIEKMYESSDLAVSFNVQSARALSAYGPSALRHDFWYCEFEDLARRLSELGVPMQLRNDLLPSETLVFLYKSWASGFDEAALSTLERAELAMQRRDYGRARRELEQAAHPQNERVQLLLAAALAYEGRSAEAIEHAKQAVALLATRLEAHETLIHLYLEQGQYAEAEAELSGLIAKDAGDPESRDNLRFSVHERLLGEQDALARACEAQAETETGRALLLASRALFDGAPARALSLLEQVARVRQDARPLPLEIAANMGLRRFDVAVRKCMALLDLDPHSSVARGAALTALRQLAAARRRSDVEATAVLELAQAHAVLGPIARRLK
ncbi:MAG: methyltransferase domain-containing protein [Myxococcota bacterium]|jgi:SAM-dependent methyltransferase|nr:methyltransferase domain-containing protein [Myxococcota bacterium]